ncbi:MAG TPA: NUDIX domain-containing protein [Rubrivivax sp.]|nr:NUDIX domain-containing protein [Rubrivivax sp.]
MGTPLLSCGILVFNPKTELLLGHATGSARWDIPKGIAEEGESPLAAALREAAEEAGLRLPGDALVEVGRFSYVRGKDLALFGAVVEGLDSADCVCTSHFRDSKGRSRPEMDAFRWVAWDQVPRHCGRSMTAVLATLEPEAIVARCRTVSAGNGP